MKTPALTARELKMIVGVLRYFTAADGGSEPEPPIQFANTDNEGTYRIEVEHVHTAIRKIEAAGIEADRRRPRTLKAVNE